MNESVVITLIDEFTRPARSAQKAANNLLKDMKRLSQVSFKSSGFLKQVQAIEKTAGSATKSVQKLRQSISHPTGSGFSRSTGGFTAVRNAANQASQAVQHLQARIKAGGSFGGGGSRGSNGVRGGGNVHRGRSFGVGGPSILHAFETAGAFEAVHAGIHATAHTIREGFAQAFSAEHTRAQLVMQGENAGLVDQAAAKAREMTKSLPQFTSAQNFAAIAELKPALIGGMEEAIKLGPVFQKAVGVLESVKVGNEHSALHGIDAHGEALDLVRAVELKGVMKDGEGAIQSYVNNMTKAIVAFNGQINAADFHSAIKMAGSSARPWSEDFMTQYLPTIINDLKSKGGSGQMAGTALMSMYRAVVDNVMTAKAAAAFDDLGMYNQNAFQMKKKGGRDYGKLKIGEHMHGYDVYRQNPLKWMDEFLLPAIAKKNGGVLPEENEIISKLTGLFGNRVAARVATIMMVQKQQLEKDAENVRRAQGVNGLEFLLGSDPVTRMQVFSASLRDLGGSIAELGTSGVMRSMAGVIGWAHRMSQRVQDSTFAKGWSQHFDSFVSGLFGQVDEHNRHVIARGQDKGYFEAGQHLSHGFGSLTSSVGDMVMFVDKIGLIASGMNGLGAIFEATAASINTIRAAAQGVIDIANGKNATANRFNPFGPNGIFGGETKYQREQRLRHGLPEPKAPEIPYSNRYGAGHKMPSFSLPNPLDWIFPKAHADELPSYMKRPGADGGLAIQPRLVADGITAQMEGLMASLTAIAARGIRVPLSADTSGVANAIRGAIAAGKGGGGVTIGDQHFHISGARDPKATATEVHSAFRDAVGKHLSDIG